jgi:tetratricopeptide (TPR) repeat protein
MPGDKGDGNHIDWEDLAVFYANRGLGYAQKNDMVKAIADYNQAIWLGPTLLKTHNNRGEAYVRIGLYRQAIDDFERELELNPNDANAYANRVVALQLSQDGRCSDR